MAGITEDINAPAKILLIGKSGAGKTGSLASLVALGYNLRIVDTDKGIRTLRSLLTDPRYPYAAIIRAKGIDLNKAVRYVSVDTAMRLRTVTRKMGDKETSETLLAPTDAKAWPKVVDLLDKWKDDDMDLGSVRTWGLQDILVFDSFSTLAKCAYYFSQAMNGRLGSRDEGYDYQRDIGGAQAQLTRLLELLYDSSIKCNVIVISHITWVDESQGVASRPREATRDGQMTLSHPDGYPSAIGRALSPHMGKYFNDVYVVRSEGSGASVRRTISTVPQDGVVAKNSVWLERDYPIASGMAQIFSALRGTPVPTELIEATTARRQVPVAAASASPKLEPRSPASALATAPLA